MAKLFTSLELPPELFLQLQSAAKQFMLDESFPERREIIGVRGRGDIELVKLRLLNCVKEFLVEQGNGKRFFAPELPGIEGKQRTMLWPQNMDKIISATTPLLRRIITNERQRQYALETRSKEHQLEVHIPHVTDTGIDSTRVGGFGDQIVLIPLEASGLFFEEITKTNGKEYSKWKDELGQPEILARLAGSGGFRATGLRREDFNDLLATFHYHLRRVHNGVGNGVTSCSPPCERAIIEKIVGTGLWQDGHWGCPDPQANLCDKAGLFVTHLPDFSPANGLSTVFGNTFTVYLPLFKSLLGFFRPIVVLDMPSIPFHKQPRNPQLALRGVVRHCSSNVRALLDA